MNISLVNRIKELADQHGISIHRLEVETGCSNRSISKWDEHTPSIERVKAVADYFGITVDELLGEETPESSYTQADIDDLRFLHDNPDIRILLSASSKLSKGSIKALAEIARRMNEDGDI